MTSFTPLEKISLFLIAIALFYILRSLFSAVYIFFIGPLVNKVDFKSKGKWALVTGATDGIGKEYARQLAAKGCDIILVSRSMDKLKAVAEEIETEFKVETKVIQADFSQDNIYEGIANAISGLEIGTLVNNVGVSYNYSEYFLDIPEWDSMFKTLISTNVVSMTRMTAMVMPEMVKRRKGVIINMSSGTALVPVALLAIYGATKVYIRKLTESLRMEYASKGLIIQCVNSGFVATNMSGFTGDSLKEPSPKTFVRSALSLVGTTSDTAGYFPHHVMINGICFGWDLVSSLTESIIKWWMLNYRLRQIKNYKKQLLRDGVGFNNVH